MDLIYMNENREDIGVLQDYSLDLAFGADENSFECQIQASNHCCEKNYMLYMEGTEYGGIVDGIGIDTESNTVTYSGRTWHGVLASKVILPLQSGEGESETTGGVYQDGTRLYIEYGVTVTQIGNSLIIDSDVSQNVSPEGTVDRYLVISGDAHDCMRFILYRCGLSALFSVPNVASGINIKSYQFDRYTDAYTGLKKMLASKDMLLRISFDGSMVILSAIPKHDYSKDEEFDSDLFDFELQKQQNRVNHLICLGGGELENRLVRHLYVDANGEISETQTFFGLNEFTEVYDYANVESEEELLKAGRERLKELYDTDSLSVDFEAEDDLYNVGDIVGAVDNITGISIAAEITKKIITIKDGRTNISYKVGD